MLVKAAYYGRNKYAPLSDDKQGYETTGTVFDGKTRPDAMSHAIVKAFDRQ